MSDPRYLQEFLNRIFNERDTLRIECEISLGRNEHHRGGVDKMIYTKSGQRDRPKSSHSSSYTVRIYFIPLLRKKTDTENSHYLIDVPTSKLNFPLPK